MVSRSWVHSRAVLAAVLVPLLLGAVILVWVRIWGSSADPGSTAKGDLAGFREQGREAGITFRMAFLPGEQGENFKINLYDHGCGVAVGDYDGDGHDDIYFCNQLGKNALYRNNGDGTFEDVTDKAGVGLGDRICVGATFADTSNNGRQDLFVTSTRGGNVFFRNRGDGTFEDATEQAGLTLAAHSQTAVFFDYDNDGFLDLFVTNTAKWTFGDKAGGLYYPGLSGIPQMFESPIEHHVLYHNNRDGTFTDVTETAGLKGKGWGGDVAVFDYNEDGLLDLLVTSMFGVSQLYKNNGNGTFTGVTRDVLRRTSWGAIGSKVFDFNNDGRLDLLIVDMHSDMWLDPGSNPRETAPEMLKKKYPNFKGPRYRDVPPARQELADIAAGLNFRYEDVVFGNTLFKKLPSGKFEEVSDKANMETFWPWGVATGDFDNDGYEDVFLPSGMGFPFTYWPSALMMNNGNETFTDRAADLGIEPPAGGELLEEKIGGNPAPRSSRSAVTGDFDGDGRLDLVVSNFNDRASYYRNYCPRKNYVAFRLTGTTFGLPGPRRKTSRDAIGAVVRIFMGDEVMVRQVHGAGGYLSQSSKTVHFGLGERTKIDRVDITWPGAGAPQVIKNPAINRLHPVTEES